VNKLLNKHPLILKKKKNKYCNYSVACVASISVEFQKKKAKERDFRSFSRAKNGVRAKNEMGWGGGREETLADKPQDFENCPRCLLCPSDFDAVINYL